MAPSTTLTAKLKVHLKMAIQRLRMVQQKDEAIAKQQRRAMAQLLEQGKTDSARIRVENIIRSDLTSELHEILELYCELLLARIGLVDNPPPASYPAPTTPTPKPATSARDKSASSEASNAPYASTTPIDPGLHEPILSLIHSAPRTTIKELQTVRALLIEKYGREFGQKCTEDREGKVPERVRRKLSVEPPGRALVESYLRAIAGAYDVPFGDGEDDIDDDDDGEPGDGEKELAEVSKTEKESKTIEPPLTNDAPPKPQSPSPPSPPRRNPSTDPRISIAPPSPSTDSPNPTVKLPGTPDGRVVPAKKSKGGGGARTNGGAAAVDGGSGSGGGEIDGMGMGKVPDVDDLEKRFALLKR